MSLGEADFESTLSGGGRRPSLLEAALLSSAFASTRGKAENAQVFRGSWLPALPRVHS